jgi:hypothetical protein
LVALVALEEEEDMVRSVMQEHNGKLI